MDAADVRVYAGGMNRRTSYFVTVATVWDTAWKAAAVWTALRRRDFKWVVPLVIVNSVGLLPIAYLKVFSRNGGEAASPADG